MKKRIPHDWWKPRQMPPLEEEVFVELLRASDGLAKQFEEVFKAAGLSPTQYNVLRILRGAGPDGLACREISRRMITRDPDVTRLLDRLEKRGWIRREREHRDRRIITTRITREGLELLRSLDGPVRQLHRQQLGQVGDARLRSLKRLLGIIRRRLESTGGRMQLYRDP